MKTRLNIVIIHLWLLTVPSYGQDYYSGESSIKGKYSEYVVEDSENIAIEIWNKNNRYSSHDSIPYLKNDKEIIVDNLRSRPDSKTVSSILESVFTAKEIATYNATDNYIDIGLAVNPMTGKVIEVRWIRLWKYHNNADKTLLSIPITKLEKLEQLIIQRVIYDVPEKYKTANFVPAYFTIFSNRLKIGWL